MKIQFFALQSSAHFSNKLWAKALKMSLGWPYFFFQYFQQLKKWMPVKKLQSLKIAIITAHAPGQHMPCGQISASGPTLSAPQHGK